MPYSNRDGGIRTRDPLNPIQVRYRAALRPVPQGHTTHPREQTTKLTALMFPDYPLGSVPSERASPEQASMDTPSFRAQSLDGPPPRDTALMPLRPVAPRIPR